MLHMVTVLLEHLLLTDCSIRVSQSCIMFILEGEHVPLCPPWIRHCKESKVITRYPQINTRAAVEKEMEHKGRQR